MREKPITPRSIKLGEERSSRNSKSVKKEMASSECRGLVSHVTLYMLVSARCVRRYAVESPREQCSSGGRRRQESARAGEGGPALPTR